MYIADIIWIPEIVDKLEPLFQAKFSIRCIRMATR